MAAMPMTACWADAPYYLAGDVMGIEVEATDMLVDLGEGAGSLKGALSLLQDFAL